MDNTITLNPPEPRFQKGDLIQFPSDYTEEYSVTHSTIMGDGTTRSETQLRSSSDRAGRLAVVADVRGSLYAPYSLVFDDGIEVSWFSGQGLILVAEDRWNVAAQWQDARCRKTAAHQPQWQRAWSKRAASAPSKEE